MRPHQYRELMEALDAAVDNGYEDVIEMPAYKVLDEILDFTGTRTFEGIPDGEIIRVIQQWQERQEDL